MLLCSVYLGEPPLSDFFSKKSEKVLAQPSRFPYSTSSLQGGVAQLGERLTGSQEVRGSIPLVSTTCFFLSLHGGVAQLGERLTGSQEVRGSIPLVSTMRFKARAFCPGLFICDFQDSVYISFRNACQDPLTRFVESDLIACFLGPYPHLREVRHQFIPINRVSRYSRDTVSRCPGTASFRKRGTPAGNSARSESNM